MNTYQDTPSDYRVTLECTCYTPNNVPYQCISISHHLASNPLHAIEMARRYNSFLLSAKVLKVERAYKNPETGKMYWQELKGVV